MKKIIFLFVLVALLIIPSSAHCERLNEIPLYAGHEKTKEMIALDEEFIKSASGHFNGSKEKAAEYFIAKGWSFIKKGNWRTAVKRFNQSWLLDPKNPNVYWGLAAAMGDKGDFKLSCELFEKGTILHPKAGHFYCDYAITLLKSIRWGANNKTASIALRSQKAEKLLKKALSMVKDFPPAYFFLGVANFYQEKYQTAWEMMEKAEQLGFPLEGDDFVAKLEAKLPRKKALGSKN